jgi:hypothetical protein
MKPLIDKTIGGSGTSILRAAARQILGSLEKHEAIEGEEGDIETAIGEVAKISQMEASLVSALLIHSVAQNYVESKTGKPMPDLGQMQKVGNC